MSAIRRSLQAVPVEVDHRGVGGVRDLRDLAQLPGPAEGIADQHQAVAHVAGHDLELPVAVQVEELRARHDRHGHGPGRAQEPPREAARLRRRPRLREGQRLRCSSLEVADEGAEVERRERALATRRQADAREAETRHVLEALLPEPARRVPGRGQDVARRALASAPRPRTRRRAAGREGRRARGSRAAKGESGAEPCEPVRPCTRARRAGASSPPAGGASCGPVYCAGSRPA